MVSLFGWSWSFARCLGGLAFLWDVGDIEGAYDGVFYLVVDVIYEGAHAWGSWDGRHWVGVKIEGASGIGDKVFKFSEL